MKKISAKITMLAILLIVTFGVSFSSCSKDDDNNEKPKKGTIDAAVGTYKGKLELWNQFPNTDQGIWYDAILIVTKEANDKLKITAKSGEEYTGITPKIFTVETGAFFGENTQDVVSLSGSLEGYFNFHGANKNITVSTQKQASSDIAFLFEGVKQ